VHLSCRKIISLPFATLEATAISNDYWALVQWDKMQRQTNIEQFVILNFEQVSRREKVVWKDCKSPSLDYWSLPVLPSKEKSDDHSSALISYKNI